MDFSIHLFCSLINFIIYLLLSNNNKQTNALHSEIDIKLPFKMRRKQNRHGIFLLMFTDFFFKYKNWTEKQKNFNSKWTNPFIEIE